MVGMITRADLLPEALERRYTHLPGHYTTDGLNISAHGPVASLPAVPMSQTSCSPLQPSPHSAPVSAGSNLAPPGTAGTVAAAVTGLPSASSAGTGSLSMVSLGPLGPLATATPSTAGIHTIAVDGDAGVSPSARLLVGSGAVLQAPSDAAQAGGGAGHLSRRAVARASTTVGVAGATSGTVSGTPPASSVSAGERALLR